MPGAHVGIGVHPCLSPDLGYAVKDKTEAGVNRNEDTHHRQKAL